MPKTCPYHGKTEDPCPDCKSSGMGEFAHVLATGVTAPAYVPPHKRPIHIRQSGADTCAVACCGMVGANLGCSRDFSMDELQDYMEQKGVYVSGEKSFFHALWIPLKWLGLNYVMLEKKGIADFPKLLDSEHFIIMEGKAHVLVIYDMNSDGSFVISDPVMRKPEMSVPPSDYRFKGSTGRIWLVSRKES
jgi:hypothetical protein